MKTIFEKSEQGQKAYSLPKNEKEFEAFHPPEKFLRKTEVALPEISELNMTRHFSALAQRNVGIDNCFYPLGSCTMKLNPRVNEWAASLESFTAMHPMAPEETVQGCLAVIYELIHFLCDVTGMNAGTLTPNAGAQGEFLGVKMIAAYHKSRKDFQRNELLIPADAHGTNPATAAMAGFKPISLSPQKEGGIDSNQLKALVSDKTAGLMLTNPNTLGLFFTNIEEITSIIHDVGGLVYYDGANLNALLELVKPKDMGFDVMHINLHKTFSTPHGGGGPGSGPVLCNEKLQEFLPIPRVKKEDKGYKISFDHLQSIGQIASFYGNFAIYLRAFLYAKLHGKYGLRKIAENAVLNANYLKASLEPIFKVPFPERCMHEFVIQADRYLDKGIKAIDIAKRMLDYGIYAPTIYFPLLVKECMLIEPTECESKETLDEFVAIMKKIVEEIEANPQIVKSAPHHKPVARLDEVYAAKNPCLVDSSIYEKN